MNNNNNNNKICPPAPKKQKGMLSQSVTQDTQETPNDSVRRRLFTNGPEIRRNLPK